MKIESNFIQVQNKHPLVQCITNFVTVNDCANILLASGASPTMAMDVREVEEAVEKVQALVCNLGAIEHLESMILAGKKANALGIPVILDPVGAGGTMLRKEAMSRLLQQVHFSVIRGNASEIKAIAGLNAGAYGVDVAPSDVITEGNLEKEIRGVKGLAQRLNSVIAISGAIDIVTDGEQTVLIKNGCETMTRITGSGCMLTTLIGAFCGANKVDAFSAAYSAIAVMGIAGELADERRKRNGTGNVTFRNDLIDAIFNMKKEQIKEKLRYEVF